MANAQHLPVLKRCSREVWNKWRDTNPGIQVDLSGADLRGENLSGFDLHLANLSEAKLVETELRGTDLLWADLSRANLNKAKLIGANLNGINNDLYGENCRMNLSEANLSGAFIQGADLCGANFSKTILCSADLSDSNLSGAILCGADLCEAKLINTNFSGADLNSANLMYAQLLETNFKEANLRNCKVYGASVWMVKLKETLQTDIIISRNNEHVITVDNLEIAQFIYLLLNNENIRDVIDAITSKIVLILGRFTPERKTILDAIRNELRRRNYLPILFDFEKPASRDITETISILAHMARFIIADITDALSIPQELDRIVPGLPSVPVQPLLQASATEYVMFEHFKRYPWVLQIHRYRDLDDLLKSLGDELIGGAETKANEIRKKMSMNSDE